MVDPRILQQAEEYIPAEVHLLSGCRDEETSADVSNVATFGLPDPAGQAGGACTSALLKTLYAYNINTGKGLSYAEVLSRMRTVLKEKKMTQIPQLSSSRPLDVHENWKLVPDTHNGTKRAVMIGINYRGMTGELTGCHNDINNMKTYIKEVHGFQEENITMLMDDGVHTEPTKANILNAFSRLVKQCQPGDAVFCHYAGHGGSIVDTSGDEEDGYDETMIPLDYKESGQIVDDDLFRVLICPLPKGVVMTCLVDCCHSGTILDLPFSFKLDGKQKQMKYDPNFHFPHKAIKAGKDGGGGDGPKEWHWSVYVVAMIPVAVAIAIPVVLWMLPSGSALQSENSEPETPAKQGPAIIRFLRNLIGKRKRG